MTGQQTDLKPRKVPARTGKQTARTDKQAAKGHAPPSSTVTPFPKPETLCKEPEQLCKEPEPFGDLEPLPGSVTLQFTRCGKPECHCSYGRPHGPYAYRLWREGDKVRKVYVKITEIERVRRQTALYEQAAAELRRLKQLRQTLWASIIKRSKEFKRTVQAQDLEKR